MTHLDEGALRAHLDGQLDAAGARHLEQCAECRVGRSEYGELVGTREGIHKSGTLYSSHECTEISVPLGDFYDVFQIIIVVIFARRESKCSAKREEQTKKQFLLHVFECVFVKSFELKMNTQNAGHSILFNYF